jgi:hypothetical protein
MLCSRCLYATGHQLLSAECSWGGEPLDCAEGDSGTSQRLNNIDSVHISAAKSTPHSQGVLEFQTQPEWAMKASSVVKNAVNVSQRGWQKLSASDWRKHIKLVVFMLVAVIIVSMQVINSSPNSPFFGS